VAGFKRPLTTDSGIGADSYLSKAILQIISIDGLVTDIRRFTCQRADERIASRKCSTQKSLVISFVDGIFVSDNYFTSCRESRFCAFQNKILNSALPALSDLF